MLEFLHISRKYNFMRLNVVYKLNTVYIQEATEFPPLTALDIFTSNARSLEMLFNPNVIMNCSRSENEMLIKCICYCGKAIYDSREKRHYSTAEAEYQCSFLYYPHISGISNT